MYALVLAGGRGERLRPLTDDLPKPMVPLHERPILWHQARWLTAAGVTDIVFLAGYRWEAIRRYFGDGAEFGFRAHYSVEEKPLGRGGAIRMGMERVPPAETEVVVTNGDVVTRQDLASIHRRFLERRNFRPATRPP